MTEQNIPIDLLLAIGEGVEARYVEGIRNDDELRTLVRQASSLALEQLSQEHPELAMKRAADHLHLEPFAAYYDEVLGVILQVPSQMFFKDPHNPKMVSMIESSWTALREFILEDFFHMQPEQGVAIPVTSDNEDARTATSRIP